MGMSLSILFTLDAGLRRMKPDQTYIYHVNYLVGNVGMTLVTEKNEDKLMPYMWYISLIY